MDKIQWILQHKTELLQIWASVIAIASVVVKLLPPLPANSWLLPIVKFIGKYLALNTHVADDERPVL